MNSYCLVVVVVLIFVLRGWSLMCYECSTLFDEEDSCGEEEFDPEEIETIECNATEICMIHIAPALAVQPKITQRGCVDSYFCNKVDEHNGHCIICKEDLCNESSTVTSSFIVAFICFLLYRLYENKY